MFISISLLLKVNLPSYIDSHSFNITFNRGFIPFIVNNFHFSNLFFCVCPIRFRAPYDHFIRFISDCRISCVLLICFNDFISIDPSSWIHIEQRKQLQFWFTHQFWNLYIFYEFRFRKHIENIFVVFYYNFHIIIGKNKLCVVDSALEI